MSWLDLWRVRYPEASAGIEDADAFIALGFGLNREGGVETPGASNLQLAAWLLEVNPRRRLTFTQRGVWLALEENLRKQDWVVDLPHDPDAYVDTRGALLQVWALMERGRVTRWPARVCLVAHPLQMQRALWLARKLPFEEVLIPARRHIDCDQRSIHRHTQTATGYLRFERKARLVGMVLGWFRREHG